MQSLKRSQVLPGVLLGVLCDGDQRVYGSVGSVAAFNKLGLLKIFFSRSGFDKVSLMGTKYFASFYQLNPVCFLAENEIRVCYWGSLLSGDQGMDGALSGEV